MGGGEKREEQGGVFFLARFGKDRESSGRGE